MKTIFIAALFFLIILFFLTSCQPAYKEKDGKIYYKWIHGGNMTKENTLVNDADASSFETIINSTHFSLGKDKNHVFFNSEILENADPSTFENIQPSYYKDKNYVFLLQGTNIDSRIIGADPSTFTILKEYYWSKDKNHIFYSRTPLEDATLSSFVVINENWGKDGKFYFFRDKKLDSLDYASTELLGENYIKDKNYVYYENKRVIDANPKTFKVGKFLSAYDDKYRYDFEKNVGPITEEYKNKQKDFK